MISIKLKSNKSFIFSYSELTKSSSNEDNIPTDCEP